MPGGSKLMLANTSEVVLNRRQAGSIGLSNRREHTSNVPHAAEGSFVATATDISKAVQQGVEAAMSIVGGVATQKADVNITIDSNRKVNLKGISDISSEVKRAFESESSKYTTKEEAAQIGKVVDHVVRELSTQGINV